MRSVVSAAVTLIVLSFSASADASVIWLYREIETVSASASVTNNGTTNVDSQQVSGSLFSDPIESMISANATLGSVGSGASLSENDGTLQFGLNTGVGDCDSAGCSSGSSVGSLDLIFRPDGQSSFSTRYFPLGGTVNATLTNLRTGAVIHHTDHAGYGDSFVFDFPDNDLYRFVASGSSFTQPGGGDPYADFSVRFYDRLTDEGAEFAPVPEPATLLLLGSGAAGLIARRRRTAKDTNAPAA